MPATDVNDYFIDAVPLWVGKVGAAGVASDIATTIPIASAAGLTDGRVYIVTANRVNATGTTKNPANQRETFVGKLVGTNFTECIRQVEGVAQGWEADIVLEILVTAEHWKRLVDGIQIEHNQDGTHKTPIPAKASGAEINTGTDDAKYATPKAIADSKVVISDKVQTMANKRNTPRVVATTDDATAVIDITATDDYRLSAIANPTTFSITGTPLDGEKIVINFKDAGVAKALTWDAIFVPIGVTLPATTTAGKWGYVGGKYNAAAGKVHVLAVGAEA